MALAASVALVAAGPAAGSPAERHDPERALEQALGLLGAGAVASSAGERGRELTLLLREVALGLDRLDAGPRRQARALLARPTDRDSRDYFGQQAARSPLCDVNFCVHWAKNSPDAPAPDDADANGIPDFVDQTLAAARQSFDVTNAELGWRKAIADGSRGSRRNEGADGQVDIYLMNLRPGLFGYAATDPGQRGIRQHGYLVLDQDFAGYRQPPLDLMRATIAHEYNHILQFAYDIRQEDWIFESTATWAEDRVFPEIDDYLQFLPSFTRNPHRAMAELGPRQIKVYGSAVWNHWLSSFRGPSVVRAAWEQSPRVKPPHWGFSAYDGAIRAAGGSSFSRDFASFAVETAEWGSSPLFPDSDRYPDMRRSGKLKRGSREIRLEHTGYRLLRVKVRGGAPVRLSVRVRRGPRAAIALVGRSGPRDGGTVRSVSRYLKKGGRGSVVIDDPASLNRLTAVVVNADARLNRFGYRFDRTRFKLKLKRDR
jgi:hypothetical protein